MATLRDIKNRITGITSIQKITSAMKMVSSIKSRRAQRQAESSRPYRENIEQMLGMLLRTTDAEVSNPLLSKRTEIKNVCIIVVAADKGMCGAFNNSLFKLVEHYIANELMIQESNVKIHIIAVGSKAVDYFKKHRYNISGAFFNAFQKIDFSVVQNIRLLFEEKFVSGELDKVEIFYNSFVSMLKQIPNRADVLPANPKMDISKKNNIDYIFEPNREEIFNVLLNQYIDLSIWGPLLESNAAEQAARLFAMDKATQNAQDLMQQLELQYNNARQAAITTEMLEIVGGAEALKG